MQKDVQAKVLSLLQTATSESDIEKRLKILLQTQALLLDIETSPHTVNGCLDYYLNLRGDPHLALRRFAARFLQRLVLLKPVLALRCVPAVILLLGDSDAVVQELAACCARALHGRALYYLGLEGDTLQFQKQTEHFYQLRDAMLRLLEGGCPGRPSLFQQLVLWARMVVLSQTPSPLVLRVQAPPELRGCFGLQDLPTRPDFHLDRDLLQRQAEMVLGVLEKLLDEPPQGLWSRSHVSALVQAVAALGRQRPSLLGGVLELLRRLLEDAHAMRDGSMSASASLPVPFSEVVFFYQLVLEEVQRLLASGVASNRRGELVELLRSSGVPGTLEDVLAQAKYHQICGLCDRKRKAAEVGLESRSKLAKGPYQRRAWTDPDSFGRSTLDLPADSPEALCSEEASFDCDAVLTGEVEVICRRFEDYFGLPSQREPAGYVAGPALLASRRSSRAELARLALKSLNFLAEKRFLLRDKAHERVILFKESVGGARVELDRTNSRRREETSNSQHAYDIALFLAAKLDESGEADGNPAAARRDPRAALISIGSARTSAVGVTNETNKFSQVGGGSTIATTLPSTRVGKDSLQLLIYNEVLESQGRMDASLLSASFSAQQVDSFERLGRQVALHLISGRWLTVSPDLQRAMCRAFLTKSLDALKASLASKAVAAGSVQLGQLVELFYAKYSSDVSKSQDVLCGKRQFSATELVEATSLMAILASEPRGGVGTGPYSYACLFGDFLAEFERRELDRRQLRVILAEIPSVPMNVFAVFEEQCRNRDGKERKVALMTLLALIESRPSCRWQGLRILFRLTYSAGNADHDKAVRFDTIRLIINKIYTAGVQPPMRWQLPHLSEEEAANVAKITEGTDNIDGDNDEFISLEKLRWRVIEDFATLMLRSMAPLTATFRFHVVVSKRMEQLRESLSADGSKICLPADRVWLYLALCIKRPVLLHGLVETFTQCEGDMQSHFVSSVEEAIKYIPASEPELLALVQKATPQTERLVLKVLHILMQTGNRSGKDGLTTAYGDAVTRLYGITRNPRLLVPVFDLLDRRNLLDFLPPVLHLDKEAVTDAFGQLIQSRSPPLTVTELLTELHHMNKPTENIIPVKLAMQALNIVFGMRDKFDQKVYGIVIQSLVEEPGPLPTLFMRTVIQVVKELPRLSDFVLTEILPRLVRQEVYADENMWKGFMIVLQHTFASQPGGAARVLALLPSSHLEDVLVQHPEWKAQLVEYVARQPLGTVPLHVRQLLH